MSKIEHIDNNLNPGYREAVKFAKSHYENFPVISKFLPEKLRKHIAVIYMFARQADDIADEGICSDLERIYSLQRYKQQLENALNGKYANMFWQTFHETISIYNLTHQYFFDLLNAFEQDITTFRYNNFNEILNYCERSANPVGRLVLEFFNIRGVKQNEFSDAICTALQLTNFYQDVSVDILKGRIYIPVQELNQFQVNESVISNKNFNDNFGYLMKFQADRAAELFKKGQNLLPLLPPRLRFQIRLTILGGEEILYKIKKQNYDVLNKRPKLSKIDYFKIFIKAVTG